VRITLSQLLSSIEKKAEGLARNPPRKRASIPKKK
jgi:hypothetical protein